MYYTEEDIRNAFKAGLIKGSHQSYFDAPLDEDEYIEQIKRVKNNFVLADVSGSLLFSQKDIEKKLNTLGLNGKYIASHFKSNDR